MITIIKEHSHRICLGVYVSYFMVERRAIAFINLIIFYHYNHIILKKIIHVYKNCNYQLINYNYFE